jgi:maltoporin
MGIHSLFQGAKMKRLTLSFLINILFIIWSGESLAIEADFAGYLRGGTGLNLQGGKQECFNSHGIPSNFVRLGNECSFYSELAITFHNKKAEKLDPVYFVTQVRLQNGAAGTRQWEAAANRDINQLEAFVKAGGFSEVEGQFWIGKRFYRNVDLNIFDWYYYADMSGVGAGIEKIPLGQGLFSIAHLIQANDTITKTSVGRPVLQALDLRWEALPFFAEQKMNTWAVYAWAPASSEGVNQYQSTDGYSLAARVEGPVFNGKNNFSLLYGKGTMKDFNIYANSAVPDSDSSQNRAWNLRWVEDWTHDVSDRWAFMLGLAGEYGDNGNKSGMGSNRQWQALGVRPIYFVSDRFQWVFEAGYSHFKNDSEVNAGVMVGDRELSRLTVASQLSLSKSIWGRPVMRVFVTHSLWNSGNQSYIAQVAPTFANRTEGTSLGYQFEAWF